MKNIVVAGYGPVGEAVYHTLYSHNGVETFVDDPHKNYDESAGLRGKKIDGVVVCVATPMNNNGFCTMDNVYDVIGKYGQDQRYLIKSAVDPVKIATIEKQNNLNITVSPEFLRGTTGADPIQDFKHQTYAIYGGGSMRWWHELFKPVLPDLETVRFCSLEQAAFAKYVENSFLATKVTFFNQMYEIYQSFGFKDFDVMVEAISVDPRIGISHTQVPGPDDKYGYGGHCLPKDISAIKCRGEKYGANVDFLKAVQKYNTYMRGDDEQNN